jgi:hypothetical protein
MDTIKKTSNHYKLPSKNIINYSLIRKILITLACNNEALHCKQRVHVRWEQIWSINCATALMCALETKLFSIQWARSAYLFCSYGKRHKTKLHGLRQRANYTNRATAVCRWSDCQHFADRGCHVVSVTDPYGRILGFLDRSRYFTIK